MIYPIREQMSKSRTAGAIQRLEDLRQKLGNVNDEVQGENWKAAVANSFELYFGKDSDLLKRLKDLRFTEQRTSTGARSMPFTYYTYNGNLKKYFSEMIISAIEHIQHNGIIDNYIKTNFLSSFSTGQILTGIATAGGILFSSGLFLGNIQNNRDLLKIEKALLKSNDTISILQKEYKELDELHQRDALYLNYCDSMAIIWKEKEKNIKYNTK